MPLVRHAPDKLRESLARAERFAFGRTQGARSRRNAHNRRLRDDAGAAGFDRDNIVGFGVGTRMQGDREVECVRLFVRRKASREALAQAGAKPFPATFFGVPTAISELPQPTDAKDAASPPIRPGLAVGCAGSPQLGTLTGCVEAGGSHWVVSCAHVLALASEFPQAERQVRQDGTLVGTLAAWDPLWPGQRTATDVALCKPAAGCVLAKSWPDGRAIAGTRPLAQAVAPLTAFGAVQPGGVVVERSEQVGTLTTNLPDGSPIIYRDQVALTSLAGGQIVDFGDSGAPVVDAEGFLVAMVVAKSDDNTRMWATPWETVQARLETLAGA